MGWKSTLDITRAEAISAIMKAQQATPYDKMSNEELIATMDKLGIGDDPKKPYYGHNFWIHDSEEEKLASISLPDNYPMEESEW